MSVLVLFFPLIVIIVIKGGLKISKLDLAATCVGYLTGIALYAIIKVLLENYR